MKRILAMALSVALIAVMAIGGTVAYFTDTDEAVNVFTVGNINIEQIEEQRKDKDSTELENLEAFADANLLMPSSYFDKAGSLPEKDDTTGIWKLPADSGAIDKIVHVENTGDNPAYVRTVFAFENSGNVDTDGKIIKNINTTHGTMSNILAENVEIDGQKYNIYSYTYNEPVPAKSSADYSLLQFAMDSSAGNADCDAIDGEYLILVFTQAVQSENMSGVTGDKSGAEAATAALNAAFNGNKDININATNHPWLGRTDLTSALEVNTEESFINALKKGGKVKLLDDISIDETATIPAGVTVNLDLNGKTISGNVPKSVGHVLRNEGTLNVSGGTIKSTADNGGSAIYNAAGAKLTVTGAVVYGAPSAGSEWPSYAINNYGEMVVNGAKITSNHGAVATIGGAETIVNDAEVTVNGIGGSSHVFYGNGKLTVNGGTYIHNGNIDGSSISTYDGADVTVNDGVFTSSNGGYGPASGTNTKLTINGGVFNNAIMAWGGKIEITGGTFAKEPAREHLKSGYTTVKVGDKYVVTAGSYTTPVSDNGALATAVAGGYDVIVVKAGNYTFPSSFSGDETLICEEGVVFEGNAKLNIGGATVIGATFSNPAGTAADQTVNGTFKDCTFTGANGLRWCYSGDTTVFENCVFDGSTYGAHFDGYEKEIMFKNCTFRGFNAFAAGVTNLKMENCTFEANGRSSYNGLNLWGNTKLTNCKFIFEGKANTEWIDVCYDAATVEFTNCVVFDGTTEKSVKDVVGNSGNGVIIVDGVTL